MNINNHKSLNFSPCFKGNIVPNIAIASIADSGESLALLDFGFDKSSSYGDSYNFSKALYQGLFPSDLEGLNSLSVHEPQIFGADSSDKPLFDSRKSVVTVSSAEEGAGLHVNILTGRTSFEFEIHKKTERFKKVLNVLEGFLQKTLEGENLLINKTNPFREDFFGASSVLLKTIAKIK